MLYAITVLLKMKAVSRSSAPHLPPGRAAHNLIFVLVTTDRHLAPAHAPLVPTGHYCLLHS